MSSEDPFIQHYSRLLEELAIQADQLKRQYQHVAQLRLKTYARINELKRLAAMGAYPGPTQPMESPSQDLPQSAREKCPLCGAKIGLNLNSPTLAYADSPRVRHLMDVHKRSLDEAQELIRKYHGR